MTRDILRLASSCVAIGLLVAVPTAADARLIPKPRTYRALDLFGNGYKDSVQKDGTWRIVANARPYDGGGFAQDMALYRAAELTKAAGHTHFQILDADGSIGTGLAVRDRESLKLIVRASDSPDHPTDCRSKDVGDCVTLVAADILARIGPTLNK